MSKNLGLDILLTFIIIIMIYYCYIMYLEGWNPLKYITESFSPYYTCYMKMYDIDPRFVNNYMKFNNKHVKCGVCQDSILKLQIEPCPTNINGIPNESCDQYAKLFSSKGLELQYTKKISPGDLSNFFCITP